MTPCLPPSYFRKILIVPFASAGLSMNPYTEPSLFRIMTTSSLSFDRGTTTLACRAWMAFRMRVSRSAIGSDMDMGMLPVCLPARLHDPGNLALERERPEADAAHVELAEERARTPAERTPVVL